MASWFQRDTLPDANSLLEGENPSKGIKMLKRLAEHGNIEAQYELGGIFEFGYQSIRLDVDERNKVQSPNVKEAIKWFKLAADKGHLAASDRLWRIYLSENNIDKDKALKYLKIAAEKGVGNAQRFLGACYMDGSVLPVQRDFSNGIKWLSIAAKSADSYESASRRAAQIELAKAYRDGTGVDIDLMKSYMWFSIAAMTEVADQQKSMALHHKWNTENPRWAHPSEAKKGEAQIQRDVIAKQLTKSQIIEAQHLAEKCVSNNYEHFD